MFLFINHHIVDKYASRSSLIILQSENLSEDVNYIMYKQVFLTT